MANPKIQGTIASWANLSISLAPYGGQSFSTDAFAALDWDDKREPERVMGAGGNMLGGTDGEYQANGSMSMYLAQGVAFQEALQQIAGDGQRFGLISFDINCSWVPKRDPNQNIITAKLVGCRIAGRANKNATGSAATVLEMPLFVAEVQLIAPSGRALLL